jgi:hypothetical protein
LVREIPVVDGNGDELVVYEFVDRRFIKKVRRLKLCTGEHVERAGDSFVVVGSGEKLTLTT